MLELAHIQKRYKTGDLIQTALDDVSVNFRDNEFVAILGPSGSGKTTLLNIIGGLDSYDSGDLVIEGISTKKYRDKDWDAYRNHSIGFVFQSYNLIMHQTVLANVELALTIAGISKSERQKRALEALDAVGLKDQAHKRPNQMSGGQMQRVAIARALINDPQILLADEPTGALDSTTSIQIMNLLKEVAKDRLVIMVTHAPELAHKYATRIVELRDGKIINDSKPYEVDKEDENKDKKPGKASMSFLTALSLSFSNLKTKKARTILTAFAGSIGIIGISLILALSTGVNDYIEDIERETMSEYPITIESSGLDITSLFQDVISSSINTDDDDSIGIQTMITSLFKSTGTNDLASLKTYIEEHQDELEDYVSAIEYEYDLEPLIYSSDTEEIRQINPDTTFSSAGSSSMFSSSTSIFYALPSSKDLYINQYDLKAGSWPTSYNEVVLVLNSSGNISDILAYALGLRDYSELESLIAGLTDDTTNDAITYDETYSYEDILGISFKLVNRADLYEYDEDFGIYIDKSEDDEYMREVLANSEDITIVGIVAPKADATVTMLTSGINYLPELIEHIVDQATTSDIVQKQLANPDTDVFSGNDFDDPVAEEIDFSSFFSIDVSALQSAFSIDTDVLQEALEDVALDELELASILDVDIKELIDDSESINLEALRDSLMDSVLARVEGDIDDYLDEYSEELWEDIINSSEVLKQIEDDISSIMSSIESELEEAIMATVLELMNDSISEVAAVFSSALKIDASVISSAFSFDIDTESLTSILTTLLVDDSSSYESNLKSLGYIDFDEPSSISLYPKDFDSKSYITEFLDEYNATVEDEYPDRVISYTDYVGTIMSSVTDIINVISYVLIAFVAISLIVSSIMIGVITYISVLERKKEIGILRAIGASKGNISAVFNAETFIIGSLSGLIGVGLSSLALIPINAIIHTIADSSDVSARLPIEAGIILVALSIGLTIIGGLLPSKKAANSDPVEALRTE